MVSNARDKNLTFQWVYQFLKKNSDWIVLSHCTTLNSVSDSRRIGFPGQPSIIAKRFSIEKETMCQPHEVGKRTSLNGKDTEQTKKATNTYEILLLCFGESNNS